jgi:hypothetical protein
MSGPKAPEDEYKLVEMTVNDVDHWTTFPVSVSPSDYSEAVVHKTTMPTTTVS